MMNPDGTFQQDIQCIVPEQNCRGGIFVSNFQAACNPNTLKKNKIGAVITAIKGKNLSQKIPKHVEYLYIPVIDHQSCDISVFFKDSFQFIEEQRKRTNVLVHCMAGVSRSVTLIIAYIMQKSNIPYQTAFNYVKSKRKIIHPNQSFIKQLKDFEKKIMIKLQDQKLGTIQNKQINKNLLNKPIVDKSNEAQYQMDKTASSTKYGSIKGFYPHKTDTQGFKRVSKANQNYHRETFHCETNIKQNSGVKESNYDRMLRQSIKQLFHLTNSQSKFFDKKQLIR